MTTLSIGLLVFPKVQQLDLTGPYEVFASLPGAAVHLIWKTLDPIVSATGLVLVPDTRMADCPPLDVLCVPGGVGVNALMEDALVLDFLRQRSERARFVTSVCTGALVLAAAGLLDGRRATTHWASHDLLARLGAVPEMARVVTDGRFISGGGVTAGIDMALTVAAELVGRAQAETVQLSLEYAPAPPFDAGTPETAPPKVLAAARRLLSGTRQERERIVARLVAAR